MADDRRCWRPARCRSSSCATTTRCGPGPSASGPRCVWCPGRGLNGAVADGVAALRGRRASTRVVVAHADLPLATRLDWVADFPGVTLVPDRRDDGTNVLAVPDRRRVPRSPTAPGRSAATGPRPSRLGLPVRVVRDPRARLGRRRARPTSPAPGWRRPTSRARRRRAPAPTVARDRRAGADLPTPARALAIGAHPDDVEFGCGATLAKWAAGGLRGAPPRLHRRVEGHLGPATQDLAAARRHCARTSSGPRPRPSAPPARWCSSAGPTASSTSGVRQRWEVAYWIRRLRPDVVLGHDPWKRYRLHPDHRHAGFLTVDGVVAARDPHFFPEQALAPPPARRRCCCSRPTSPTTSRTVGEADVAAQARRARGPPQSSCARRCTSRWARRPRRAQLAAFRARVRDRLAEHGPMAGVPLGEAFKALTDL